MAIDCWHDSASGGHNRQGLMWGHQLLYGSQLPYGSSGNNDLLDNATDGLTAVAKQ